MQSHLVCAIILLVTLFVAIESAAVNISPTNIDFFKLYDNPEAHISFQGRRTTADRIAAHGYPSEHHHVVTDDGYILGVFRIPYSHKLQNQNEYRPIVLIQHGLTSCSDIWTLCGPNDALPFLLADTGFDVWLGNARGTTYSRNHTSRSTQHPNFWNFSWHEIGFYDIAAMIDYALKTNGQGQKSIHYVGHSQGTTAFFTLMSMRPEYNDKIKTAHMFAPIAIMTHMKHSLVRSVGPYLGHQNSYSLLFSSQEIIPYNNGLLTLFSTLCAPDQQLKLVCDNAIDTLYSDRRVNKTAMPEYYATHPAGCSSNQMLHYLQEQQSGHFRQYDHGIKKNLEVYKSEQPPNYPVEKIGAQLHLWYSDNDEMAAVEDVLELADRLPKRTLHHMEDPLWDHKDYPLSFEARKYLNEPVIKIMMEFEEHNNALL